MLPGYNYICINVWHALRHKRCVSCLTIHIPNIIYTEYQVVIITHSRSLACVITN